MDNSIKFKLLFVLVFACLCVNFSSAGPHGGHSWCYSDPVCGPKHWVDMCHSGKIQSPVDFNSDNIHENRTQIRMRFNKAYFDVQKSFFVKNNGHTIQVQLTEDLSSKLVMDGDGLKGAYVFSQFHFHWGAVNERGSEHTVSGKAYPLELHLVHYNEMFKSLGEAVGSKNHRALAVLGIFFELSDKDNKALEPIIQSIPGAISVQEEAKLINHPLNISSFLPKDLSLFRYYGSLTTPSCFEIVHWNVFTKPVPISKSQLEAFRKVQDGDGEPLVDNFRPTLPLAGRKVVEYEAVEMDLKPEVVTSDFHKPEPDRDYEEAMNILELDPKDNSTIHPGSNRLGNNTTSKKNGAGLPATNTILLALSGVIISLRLKL